MAVKKKAVTRKRQSEESLINYIRRAAKKIRKVVDVGSKVFDVGRLVIPGFGPRRLYKKINRALADVNKRK